MIKIIQNIPFILLCLFPSLGMTMDLAPEADQKAMSSSEENVILDISDIRPQSLPDVTFSFSLLVFNSQLQPPAITIPSDISGGIIKYLSLGEQLAFGRTSKQFYHTLHQSLQLTICRQRIQKVFATHDIDTVTHRDFASLISKKTNRLLSLTQKIDKISQESLNETTRELGMSILASFEKEADAFFDDVEIAESALVFLNTNSHKDLDYLKEIYHIEREPTKCCDQFGLKQQTFCQDPMFAVPCAFLTVGVVFGLVIGIPFMI